MLTLSKRTITLDFDSTALRMLIIQGKRVERWASTSLEPGLVEEGMISDPLALGARVKQLMESSKIKGGKVIASLSGLYSVSRIVSVPQLAGQSVQAAVQQAAKEAVPLPAEEFSLTWQMVADDETGQRAFVLSTPRNLIDAEMRALRSAKATPYILNLKGMALIRLVNQRQALVVNMEPDSFDIVLVANGIPHIMRTITRQQNIPLEDWVERLAKTLDQITYFYDSQHPQSPLNPNISLFLAGQLAENHEVVETVQEKTQYPIAPLAIPLEYPKNLPVSQYAVNIGLALKQTSIPEERMETSEQPSVEA